MSATKTKRRFGKLQLGFALITIAVVAVLVILLLANRVDSINQDRLAKMEQAVRITFPRFCRAGQLLIDSSIEHADKFLGIAERDEYLVGCSDTVNHFGYAFELNVITCKVQVMSLTLVTELSADGGAASNVPGQLIVCPPL